MEDQLTNLVTSSRTAASALRSELLGRIDVALATVGQRVDVIEAVAKQQQQEIQVKAAETMMCY